MSRCMQIEGFPDYDIFEDGRVFSRRSNKYLSNSLKKAGYFRVSLSRGDGESYEVKELWVHRIVAKHFVENPRGVNCVNHKDGNKLNNKSSNLEWCTQSENWQHAKDTGLFNIEGSKHPNSKLNEMDIRFIRIWSVLGYKKKDISEAFGVDRRNIYSILSGNTWRHV